MTSRPSIDRDRLERGFRRLSPEQAAIFVLHHYVGLSQPEIAEELGVPLGTVKSRLHYATSALRAALEADARTALLDGASRMTTHADFDRIAAAWLVDGPDRTPGAGAGRRRRRDPPDSTAAGPRAAVEVPDHVLTRSHRGARRRRGARRHRGARPWRGPLRTRTIRGADHGRPHRLPAVRVLPHGRRVPVLTWSHSRHRGTATP